MEKTSNKRLNDILESLSLDEEVKIKIYEYLLNLRESGISQEDDFVIRIPHLTTNSNFLLNRVIRLSDENLDKNQSMWEIIGCNIENDLNKIDLSYYQNFPRPQRIVNKRRRTNTQEIDVQADTIKLLIGDLEQIKQDLSKLKKENDEFKELIYADSKSYNSEKKTQTIPVEIYLDTNEPSIIFGVYESVLDFLKSIDFEKSFEFNPIKGSWFKRMVAKSKSALTSDEVTERLKEAEYGIEVNAILKQQSEIDKNQSEALLNILKSVERVPNAAIRIGSLLVVKLTNQSGEVNVQVRSLSIKELHLLNKKPELLHSPKNILNALTEVINGENNGRINNN